MSRNNNNLIQRESEDPAQGGRLFTNGSNQDPNLTNNESPL